MSAKTTEKTRCPWCTGSDIYVRYHDKEWGVPVRDSQALFAKLILDGAQAGLSWLTILKKRENYYRAFDDFDPRRIATYTAEKKAELMADAGIVRNRLKIEATVLNAQAYLRMEAAGVDFSEYLWSFTGGRPQVNALKSMAEIRASSPESDAMSKALKKEGFKFVGTTICYAFMQAVGMVNDHMVDCWRYKAVAKMR